MAPETSSSWYRRRARWKRSWDSSGETASWGAIARALAAAVLGILPFAAAISGHLFAELSRLQRILLLVSAALLLVPTRSTSFAGLELPLFGLIGILVLAAVAIVNWKRGQT